MMRAAAASFTLILVAGAAAADPDRGVMQHKDGFADAATSPLDDFNLRRIEIPGVLKRAVADPYDLKGLKRCEQIAAEVGRLDEALGPDLDEPPPPKGSKFHQAAQGAHDAAVEGAKDEVRHFIPFRGWIRQLTGAERHAKKVQAAIRAGGVRRGYLKGVGMNRNCAPPAAPKWFQPAANAPNAHSGLGDLWASFWAGLSAWFRGWWPF